SYVYEPARPLQKLGVIVHQFPAKGTLSSYDKVTLVLPKALQGAVPRPAGRRSAAGGGAESRGVAARAGGGEARPAAPEGEGRRQPAVRRQGGRAVAALGTRRQ